MSEKYKSAVQQYAKLALKARMGDRQAHDDKAKAMQEVRHIEREAARSGAVLSRDVNGLQVGVSSADAPSKRSLQGEYVRKFDETPVVVKGMETSLRAMHSKRLLGK